jgi:hypothetical protein
METTDPKPNLVSISVRMAVELHIELKNYVNDQQSAARLRREKPLTTMDGEIQAAIRERLDRLKSATAPSQQTEAEARQAAAEARKQAEEQKKAEARLAAEEKRLAKKHNPA